MRGKPARWTEASADGSDWDWLQPRGRPAEAPASLAGMEWRFRDFAEWPPTPSHFPPDVLADIGDAGGDALRPVPVRRRRPRGFSAE